MYLINGGEVTLTVSGATQELAGKWVNMYTGAEEAVNGITNGAKDISAPWSNAPCVLWLKSDVTAIEDNSSENHFGTNVFGMMAKGQHIIEVTNLLGRVVASLEYNFITADDFQAFIENRLGLTAGLYLIRLKGKTDSTPVKFLLGPSKNR